MLLFVSICFFVDSAFIVVFLWKWSRVVFVSGYCYLIGIVFVGALQGFGFPR